MNGMAIDRMFRLPFFKSAAFYIISAEVEPGLGKQRKCFARYPASALELAA
jgi:hypothetical protein